MKEKKFTFIISIITLLFLFIMADLTAQTAYVNYAEALQKSLYFYDAEYCGYAGTNKLQWRGPCHMEDAVIPLTAGTTNLTASFISSNKAILDPDGDGLLNLIGGFHDAGDHVQFGLPQGYTASTLGWGLYEFKQSFIDIGEYDHMLEILKYFTDFFLRCTFRNSAGEVVAYCFQTGDGSVDHSYWGPPELQVEETYPRPAWFATPDKPAGDECGNAAASLAAMYFNYRDIDATYAAKCLDTAKALYAFGAKYRGMGDSGGYYGSAYDHDELSWAAVWLYEATGDMKYIDDIAKTDASGKYTGYMQRIIASSGNNWQNIWVHCWDVVWGGTFVKLAILFPEDEFFNYIARWNIEYWSGGAIKHKDTTDGNYMKYTPAGYGMINTWGSARYNTAAELCALIFAKHKNRTDMADWAKGQMTYIMGANPMSRSYIVGYGDSYAEHPHHRAAHGSQNNNMNVPPEHRHLLWGALVGGPDGDDYHNDVTTDYVYNEVAIDYNAGFVGALAGFYDFYGRSAGHKKVANFPPLEPEITEYFVEAKLEQENKQRTQVTVKLHSEPVHPPRFETGLACRYYFNITELVNAGQTISAVKTEVYYDEQASRYGGGVTVKGPTVFNAANNIYYLEMDWGESPIFGSREFQFGVIAAQAADWKDYWDPTNDFSRTGIGAEYTSTNNIPLLHNGTIVYGNAPTGGPTSTPTRTPTGSTPTPTRTPTGSVKLGDVNGNGIVDIVDALMTAQYSVGLNPTGFIASAADVNKNGTINIVDALMIAQYYVGIISGF